MIEDERRIVSRGVILTLACVLLDMRIMAANSSPWAPVASMMISKDVVKGGVVSVGVKGGELTFEVKKGRKGSLWTQSVIETKQKTK